jgi:hypothetical protein
VRDVGLAVEAVNANSDVAQARHHPRARASADTREIFAIGDVANVVQSVLDVPVIA